VYYSHKYAQAEHGAYVTQLLSCVLTLTPTLTPTLTLALTLTGLSSRQSPTDEHYRSVYYSHKYAQAEHGAYVTQLLSCVLTLTLT
jgi:hypothetical protein